MGIIDRGFARLSKLAASGGAVLIGANEHQTQDEVNKERITPERFGAVGDGVWDDTDAFIDAAALAISEGKPITLTGGNYVISSLNVTSNLEIIGNGTITKKSGTTGSLIQSSSDLRIAGKITLNQNAENCQNPSATAESDCAIFHTGSVLELIGVTLPDSVSANIRTNAAQKVHIENCDIYGGWLCLLAATGVSSRVKLTNNRFSGATKNDNVQVLNARDVLIDGNTSSGAFRSGIVVSNAAESVRITHNLCFGNKIDAGTNQGGWGIVCSVSVARLVVSGNVLKNNQRGPIAVDTYTTGLPDNSTAANGVISNNICDGDYNGVRGTTGVAVNGARYMTVTGNRIRRVAQGVLAVDSDVLSVTGNTIEDCSAYFVQFLRCEQADFSANILRGCTVAGGAAVLQFLDCIGLTVNSNQVSGLDSVSQAAFRLNACSDYVLAGNTFKKETAGDGRVFVLVASSANGRIRNNLFLSPTNGWQYYIEATGATITDVVTEHNEIVSTGMQTNPNRYVLNGASIVGDGDSINGIRDKFSAAPTNWTFRNGYMAINNNVAQFWNGTNWVNI